jgi:hypothetical protein
MFLPQPESQSFDIDFLVIVFVIINESGLVAAVQ